MGWTVTRDFFLNLAAGIVGDPREPTGMIGYIIATGVIFIGVRNWHRKRLAEEKRGVDSFYVIALLLGIAAVAIGGACYGVGVRSAAQSAQVQPTSVVTPEPQAPQKSILVPGKYYSTQDKERISEILFAVSAAFNKVLPKVQSGLNAVTGGWDRPNEDLKPYLARITETQAAVSELYTTLFDKILPENKNYSTEVDTLLERSNNGLSNMQTSLNEYLNALTVFNDYQGVFHQQTSLPYDPRKRENLVRLISLATHNLTVQADNSFRLWAGQCKERIEATQKAMR